MTEPQDPTPSAAWLPPAEPSSDPWAPGASTSTTPPVPPVPPVGGAPADGPELLPVPAPTARRRPARVAAIALATVVALGAGAFGVLNLTAAEGSESPEEAVEALFAAVDDEDVLGVVEVLEPSERDLLRPTLERLDAAAGRVQVTGDDLDLNDVDGLELQVEGLELETTELRDGVVAVDITSGTVSSAAALAELPLGPALRSLFEQGEENGEGAADRTETDELDLAGLRLVALRGDGWHVSALYSLAEAVRLDLGEDEPPPFPAEPDGIPAVGASSPEDAVRDGIEAARTADVARLVELTPAEDLRVLHDYGPLLVDAAQEAGWAAPELDGLELETGDGPDGTKVVRATAFDLRAGDGDEPGGNSTRITYDGECTTTTYRSTYASYGWELEEGTTNEGRLEVDPDDAELETETHTSTNCDDDLASAASVPFGILFGSNLADLRIVTEEHDGQWFLSPTRSIVESVLAPLERLGDEDAALVARAWAGESWVIEPDGFWEACGQERPADDVDRDAGQEAWSRCWIDLPPDYDGPSSIGWYGPFWWLGSRSTATFEPVGDAIDDGRGGGMDEYEEIPDEGYVDEPPTSPGETPDEVWACYDAGEDAEVLACLEGLAEEGTISAEELAFQRCDVAFEAGEDVASTDEDYEANDRAFEECLEPLGRDTDGGPTG